MNDQITGTITKILFLSLKDFYLFIPKCRQVRAFIVGFEQIYYLITTCLLLTLIMILPVWRGAGTVAWKSFENF